MVTSLLQRLCKPNKHLQPDQSRQRGDKGRGALLWLFQRMSSSRRCEAGLVFGFRARFGSKCDSEDGGSRITIVMGDVTLMRHVIEAIGAAGRGHVTLDFADNP
jgi:hypothetical protein